MNKKFDSFESIHYHLYKDRFEVSFDNAKMKKWSRIFVIACPTVAYLICEGNIFGNNINTSIFLGSFIIPIIVSLTVRSTLKEQAKLGHIYLQIDLNTKILKIPRHNYSTTWTKVPPTFISRRYGIQTNHGKDLFSEFNLLTKNGKEIPIFCSRGISINHDKLGKELEKLGCNFQIKKDKG